MTTSPGELGEAFLPGDQAGEEGRFLHIVPDVADMTTIWRMRMNQDDLVARPIRALAEGTRCRLQA